MNWSRIIILWYDDFIMNIVKQRFYQELSCYGTTNLSRIIIYNKFIINYHITVKRFSNETSAYDVPNSANTKHLPRDYQTTIHDDNHDMIMITANSSSLYDIRNFWWIIVVGYWRVASCDNEDSSLP